MSPSNSELGVIVTERAPSSVALLLRLALSPEHAVIGAERAPSGMAAESAPSGVALSPSGVVLSPEHGVVVIVDNEAMFCGCWIWE